MNKIIDIDKLFESYMRKYVAEHSGKYTEDEWYEKLPDVYAEFESTPSRELGGRTPLDFYDDEEDLVGLWLKYVEKGVPLNDYLINAVVKKVDEEKIIEKLTEDADEEVLLSAVEILRRKGSKSAVNRYIDLLFSKKVCHHVKDEMVEDLIDNADAVKDGLLDRISDAANVNSMFAEILSHCTVKDDRIKDILLKGLTKGDKVPEYAAYLTFYDDESCLDKMTEYLDTLTDYVSYKELKIAVEALGGYVEDDKDFSGDKNYIKIKTAKDDSDKD